MASSEKKTEKSYLASAVESLNPWGGSRSATATPTPKDSPQNPPPSHPVDHTVNPFYGQSFKKYPSDCPPLKVQWFHAVDIPKRKPKLLTSNVKDEETKPAVQPKKFATFSVSDSRALEAAYQKKLEELEADKVLGKAMGGVRAGSKRPRVVSGEELISKSSSSSNSSDGSHSREGIKVPVNEDFLFDVDIEERELAPAYWGGPIYEVRRGSWFYQEGSVLRPCEENLAAQLEEGYLKVKPWTYPPRARSNSGARTVTPKSSVDNLRAAAAAQAAAQGEGSTKPTTPVTPHQPQTYRLFGTYMNSVATYQDTSVAWLSSDGVLSWVTSTVYERFAGGGYMSGVKLVRGYTEPKRAKEEKRPLTPTGTQSTPAEQDEKLQKALKRRSAPASSWSEGADDVTKQIEEEVESAQSRLTRQLSNLMESSENPGQEEEAIRRREEQEMLDDYNTKQGESQGRDIEHVVLVTHGIGQLLSLKMESLNFVHDVNTLRKTMKGVYASSADLRALNLEAGDSGPGNCRVQVLPVIWRHLLDFPKRKPRNGERDLTDTLNGEEDEYPSLTDITIEGMAFARSLISDLALDVLLYQSAYRAQIVEIVLKESNRIFRKFMERNPEFKGKVHIMGHSLGSAIMFDILCRQKEKRSPEPQWNPLRIWPSQDQYEPKDPKALEFEFEVEDFYCLGSPVGLFQMLKGRSIAARSLPNAIPSASPFSPDVDDSFFSAAAYSNPYTDQHLSPITGLPFNVSSPKVAQLYNIFHPSDPIAYRLEPLVSTAMSTLKPQALPYTKKNIFSSVAPQGLTGIGAKVGQSVSGLWSNFSAGIASSLLNRSLGLTQEDVAKMNAQQHAASPGAGTNISGGVIPDKGLSDALRSEKADERKRQLADAASAGRTSADGYEATLIDDDLETLFSKFQKNRIAIAKEKGATKDTAINIDALDDEEKKAQNAKREETKVRMLNRNGRIDYCIQESVLDYNPINILASHMCYWADEDVSHFILSQMLANKLRTPRP
ncbi:hypothetical protein OQA88_9731 [Cercophora sp. LCS_1]